MRRVIVLLALFSLSVLFSCKEKELLPQQSAPKPLEQHDAGGVGTDMPPLEMKTDQKSAMIVEVPQEIEAVWTAVELEVTEKASGKKKTYIAGKDKDVKIKGSHLKVKVTHFMPNFTMGDGIMTSLDTEPENPAVYMVVTEGGNEIWSGVAFLLYPDTHGFNHKKYAIVLKKYIPAEEKQD
jgi:hypothetical protein